MMLEVGGQRLNPFCDAEESRSEEKLPVAHCCRISAYETCPDSLVRRHEHLKEEIISIRPLV